METLKGELATFETLKDLKALLSSAGPCVSIYMPLSTASGAGINPNGKQNELHWRECVRSLEEKAGQFGAEGRELIESIADWSAVAADQEPEGKSIAVFRSPDAFQIVSLDTEVKDWAVMGPHFYVRPLLAEVTREKSFYLLALSQKNTRLLRCTSHSSEEVPFPADTKTDFDTWMNQVKPDHTAVNNGAVGAGSRGALAPKGADREAKDEYLSHYFKQVDHGVNEVLRGSSQTLLLCGVDYEIPIYREVNHYPHLAEEVVLGAPNGLKSGEMHARALDAIQRCYDQKIDATLAEWNHKVGGGASNRLKDVITAAHDGRVLTLLVSDSLQLTGSFDEATHSVKGRETGTNADEDLVNDAAVQTVLHAGKVLVAPHHKMPNGSPVAAIFRF
jgi:hypothetical protein